jgi:hypothetical protein
MLNLMLNINSKITNAVNTNDCIIDNFNSYNIANLDPQVGSIAAPAEPVAPLKPLEITVPQTPQISQPVCSAPVLCPTQQLTAANLTNDSIMPENKVGLPLNPTITPTVSGQQIEQQQVLQPYTTLTEPIVTNEQVKQQECLFNTPATQVIEQSLAPQGLPLSNQQLWAIEQAKEKLGSSCTDVSNQTPVLNLTPISEVSKIIEPVKPVSVNEIDKVEVLSPAQITNNPVGVLNDISQAATPTETISGVSQPLPVIAQAKPQSTLDQTQPSVVSSTKSTNIGTNTTESVTPSSTPQVSSQAISVQAPAAVNSGMNMVVVGSQSQQYLSSLVNVNAAGSIVPVLLNLVININSSVGNLTNVNKLNLTDYSRYQIH